jgi:6-phosphofructokinase 1
MQRGKLSSIIVMAEGQTPGLSQKIAKRLDQQGFSTKVCILGHIQRGGTPTAHDRVLASVLGASAVKALQAGYSNCMVGVQKNRIELVDFASISGKKKEFDLSLHALASALAI